jgi:hypothetical protein
MFSTISPYNTIPVIENCTFYRSVLSIYGWTNSTSATNAIIQNNLFDNDDMSGGMPAPFVPPWITWATSNNFSYYAGGNNVYATNIVNRTGNNYLSYYPTDQILSNSPSFQSGVFGRFYLPTNSVLIDAGSTTADRVGLFYYTTQISQTNENITPVDVGYHYVASDSNGNPVDSNNDGTPDYLDILPLWQAADPNNPAAGVLTVFIDSPTNGAVLQ